MATENAVCGQPGEATSGPMSMTMGLVLSWIHLHVLRHSGNAPSAATIGASTEG